MLSADTLSGRLNERDFQALVNAVSGFTLSSVNFPKYQVSILFKWKLSSSSNDYWWVRAVCFGKFSTNTIYFSFAENADNGYYFMRISSTGTYKMNKILRY